MTVRAALIAVLAVFQFAHSNAPLRFVSDEADAALAILHARAAGRTPTAAQWTAFFSTEGYRALARRDSSFGRPYSATVYRTFLLSDTLLARRAALTRTLAAWKRIDQRRAAAMALAYLPAGTALDATVFLEIKPQGNSFVFDLDGKRAIFLYVNPTVTAGQLANTMAHELHHIGLSTACAAAGDTTAPASVRRTREWMSAFGEGLAMLAAAGGPDIHPHALDDSATRARWDRDVANVGADVARLQRFFFDVLDERGPVDSLQEQGMSFFGVQGPWYTVGWRMATTVEKVFGRSRLIAEMCEPVRLVATYNEAVRVSGRAGELPLWSDSLLARVSR